MMKIIHTVKPNWIGPKATMRTQAMTEIEESRIAWVDPNKLDDSLLPLILYQLPVCKNGFFRSLPSFSCFILSFSSSIYDNFLTQIIKKKTNTEIIIIMLYYHHTSCACYMVQTINILIIIIIIYMLITVKIIIIYMQADSRYITAID